MGYNLGLTQAHPQIHDKPEAVYILFVSNLALQQPNVHAQTPRVRM